MVIQWAVVGLVVICRCLLPVIPCNRFLLATETTAIRRAETEISRTLLSWVVQQPTTRITLNSSITSNSNSTPQTREEAIKAALEVLVVAEEEVETSSQEEATAIRLRKSQTARMKLIEIPETINTELKEWL